MRGTCGFREVSRTVGARLRGYSSGMRRHLIGIVIAGLALTACGGGSSAPLAADEVVPKLEASGLDCTETSSEAVEEGIAATAVTGSGA